LLLPTVKRGDRYRFRYSRRKPARIDASRCFDRTKFEVKDGRKVTGIIVRFGTVYGIASGKSMPAWDYTGFAPFGYPHCPGEQLTINVFEDFPCKAWNDKSSLWN